MAKPKPLPNTVTPPVSTRVTTAKKLPFLHRAGKTVYAKPVATSPQSIRFNYQEDRKIVKRYIKTDPWSAVSDQPRTLQDVVNPFSIQRSVLRTLYQSKKISLAIINQTKELADVEAIKYVLANTPNLNIRLGSIALRFEPRIVKGWNEIDPDPSTWKNPATEWLENDKIVSTEVIMVVSQKETPVLYASGTPTPARDIEYRVDVHIPPILMNNIMTGAFYFAEEYDRSHGGVLNKHLNLLAQQRPASDFHNPIIPNLESVYNKNKDKTDYMLRTANKLGISAQGAALFTARQLWPKIKANPINIHKHYAWIGKQLKAYSGDFSMVDVSPSSSSLLKGIGAVATVGNMLSAINIAIKFSNNTWTGSTVGDAVLLAGATISGIAAAIGVSGLAVTLLTAVCFGYGLIETFSGGRLGDWWDAFLPPNRPFSPPMYNFYTHK